MTIVDLGSKVYFVNLKYFEIFFYKNWMIIMNIQKITRSRGRVSFIIRFRHHIHSIVKYFSMIASVLTFCYFWSKIPLNFSLNLTSQISECLHLPIFFLKKFYNYSIFKSYSLNFRVIKSVLTLSRFRWVFLSFIEIFQSPAEYFQ